MMQESRRSVLVVDDQESWRDLLCELSTADPSVQRAVGLLVGNPQLGIAAALLAAMAGLIPHAAALPGTEMLAGIPPGILRGMVLAAPKSITPHTNFMGEVYVLTKDEGGRHKAFFNGYRPQFYIRTMDVTGEVTLPEGVEMVMPGDNVNVEVKLITPVALEQGSKFAIREGGLTVGAGVITKILE